MDREGQDLGQSPWQHLAEPRSYLQKACGQRSTALEDKLKAWVVEEAREIWNVERSLSSGSELGETQKGSLEEVSTSCFRLPPLASRIASVYKAYPSIF